MNFILIYFSLFFSINSFNFLLLLLKEQEQHNFTQKIQKKKPTTKIFRNLLNTKIMVEKVVEAKIKKG